MRPPEEASFQRLTNSDAPTDAFIPRKVQPGAKRTTGAEYRSGRPLVVKGGGGIDDQPRPSSFDSRPARVARAFYMRNMHTVDRLRFLVGHVFVPKHPTVPPSGMHPHDLRANIIVNSPGSYGTQHEQSFPGGPLR